MAMMRCQECGNSVSSKARACPSCGANVPRSKRWLLIPVGLVALFFAWPYIGYSEPERAAISARANCERMFPAERGRECDRVYDKVLRERSGR